MKRLPYPIGLVLAAGRCNMDMPRTPYAAAKELQQRGVQLVTRGNRQHVVRTIGNEGLAILRNQRSWLVRQATPWVLCLSAFATLPLIGCVSTTTDDLGALEFATTQARNRQLGLTAVMSLDTAQTVTIARSPDCLREGNPIATAIFGSANPSPQRVLATNVVYIAAHWLLSSYLDRKAETIDFSELDGEAAGRQTWKVLRSVYQVVTFLGHGGAVLGNASKGIEPFSRKRCGSGQ